MTISSKFSRIFQMSFEVPPSTLGLLSVFRDDDDVFFMRFLLEVQLEKKNIYIPYDSDCWYKLCFSLRYSWLNFVMWTQEILNFFSDFFDFFDFSNDLWPLDLSDFDMVWGTPFCSLSENFFFCFVLSQLMSKFNIHFIFLSNPPHISSTLSV